MLLSGRRRGRDRRPRFTSGYSTASIEGLEPRSLLSAAIGLYGPDAENLDTTFTPAATTVDGFSPAEIRKAYGFDQVSFANGTVAADGRGQTIAIVDAFNHPDIVNDVSVFSQQFGLPAASLTVVNQTGGSRLPSTDAGWAGEIALDVEWAHAIAPAASILLVEANSSETTDLMAAVDYARRAPGVSAVSMSWGGSEFFSFSGDESTSQLAYDPIFTTPAGHQGVTFFASAGDSGQSGGVQWPASSPNVVAVGGTSLFTDAAGNYASEGPWRGFRNGTSGGFSRVEPVPDYQQDAQQTGARSTPDVGYNGDPATGFAVYDSLPYQGQSGWDVVGGTSAGAPQWAALLAIANEGRTLASEATLDGFTQTLPTLYSVYSAPGTAGYATFTSFFNDIGTDGYGYTTGLGTPHAQAVIDLLVGSESTGTGDGNPPAPAQLPASPLTVTFSEAPGAGVGGTNAVAKVRITNGTASRFTGPVTLTLLTSTDATTSADDATAATVSLRKLNLKPGGSKPVTFRFARPATLASGNYDYIASATAEGTNTAPAEAVTPPVAIDAPTVDIAAGFGGTGTVRVRPGRNGNATVTVLNAGNVTATGTLDLTLYASTDQALDASDAVLTTLPGKKVKLKAGKTQVLRAHFAAPGVAGGSYFLIASIAPTVQPADSDAANDVASAATA
jgi:hypothetical protein